jgi:hypothetical protein
MEMKAMLLFRRHGSHRSTVIDFSEEVRPRA